MGAQPDVMRADFTLEYTFKRSLGPVLGRFVTALRERTILGVRAGDGRVLVPPSEYDPWTGAPLDELVEVGPAGRVVSWTWVAEPRPKHPQRRPFAFALVTLDGADTPLLTSVAAEGPAALGAGTRVTVRWPEVGGQGIRDLSVFEPLEG